MKIVILVKTMAIHDAIGNDVEAMYQVLSKNTYCKVYAKSRFNNTVEYIENEELESVLADADSLIIYHHGIYWDKIDYWFKAAKCKIVIRYHNITPPEFFTKYNDTYISKQCALGREQTDRLASEYPNAVWLCASSYNASDLKCVPAKNIHVCPPFNKISKWQTTTPDVDVLNKLKHTGVNLLFVGRFAPNKGHLFLLDVVYYYKNCYDTNIMLRLIGNKLQNFSICKCDSNYYINILNKIDLLNIAGNVEIVGSVNDSELLSYYNGSDIFITASNHEGFLVPLVEAQYNKLPIIARSKAAIPETIGDNQIVLGDDPKQYAAAIDVLHRNSAYCDFLIESGFQNYMSRFSNEAISSCFRSFMKLNFGFVSI